MENNNEQFELTLTPLKGQAWRATPLQRLRRLLKAALRGYGLKCVDCKAVPPSEKPKGDS